MTRPAITREQDIVLELIRTGIRAVSPEYIIPASIRFDRSTHILHVNKKSYPIKDGRIFVIGGGKAVAGMAGVVERVIGAEFITAGRVCGFADEHGTAKIEVLPSSHPVPNEQGVISVQRMLDLKNEYGINRNDTVICLISGGGSSMMTMPANGIALKELQTITDALLCSGAAIQEINIVRRHISGIKGGRLAAWFAPARVISLIISDVIGNDPAIIASGPTAPDRTTPQDAVKILKDYGLWEEIPEFMVMHFRQIFAKGLNNNAFMRDVYNHVVADGRSALNAMQRKGERLGFNTKILMDSMQGQPDMAAGELGIAVKKVCMEGPERPRFFLLGGETTPKVPKIHGKGGRNMHFAASFVLHMKDTDCKWALASVGSDGSDFIRGIAGAIVDHTTLKRAKNAGIDVEKRLKIYDSFGIFQNIEGSLIRMGKTNTNVGDLIACLIY